MGIRLLHAPDEEKCMMKSFFYVAAALALTACADTVGPAEQPSAGGTAPSLATYGVKDSLYTTQTPAEYLDAGPDGWQVATRFSPGYDGKFVGYRFYKAPGETGTHTARLYNYSGQLIHSATFSNETASGWQRVTFTTTVLAYAGDTYYVTVNTNVKQAKTYAYFTNSGDITRYWGYAFGGAYGQPINAFPGTNTGSSFFVDVYFRPVRCDDVVTEYCW
jgi:Domain of unknown function (DUF4082)